MSSSEVNAFADREGVRGPGVSIAWADRGIDPAAKAGKVKWVLETPFPDFRRLDPLARFCCLAVEALGADFVENTALVLDSTYGCLHADRKFQASLATIASAAVFPYTLPSTCLGDVAIRHKLRGPVLCLTTADGGHGAGREEAERLLALGEADAAIVLTGDVIPADGVFSIEALLLS